ncbi:MAG: hypothetical protein ACJ8AI_08915 [Rhodopila sp.]|jgi:hypothetical protein
MSDSLTQTQAAAPIASEPYVPATTSEPARRSSFLRRSMSYELPYILMLALALAGAILHMPIMYWLGLTPLFGIVCIVAGWRNFKTSREQIHLLFSQVLIWCALMVAIYVLYSSGVQGLAFNPNANPMALVTLLALGTFVAGVQARLWQTCAVGIVLFLAVPGLGWINQSLIFLVGLSAVVVVLGGIVWAIAERRADA